MRKWPYDAQIEVEFQIRGRDFDADACSRAIGLSPTRIWHQRRAELRDQATLPNTIWAVGFEGWFDNINEPLDELLIRLDSAREKIREYIVTSGLSARIEIAIKVHDRQPECLLRPAVLRRVAELESSLAFEIFDYSQDD